MYIDLHHIKDLFPEARTQLHQSDAHLCLTGFQHLALAPEEYSYHTIYLTDDPASLLQKKLSADMHFVISTSDHRQAEAILQKLPVSVNYLLIEQVPLSDITLQLQRFYDTKCGVGFLAESFIDYLIEDTSIQEIVDHDSSMALKNPIFVFDSSFNLIASHTDFPTVDTSAQTSRLLTNQGFTLEEFQHVKRNHIHERVMSSAEPILIYNEVNGFEQMFCAITTKRNWGHIVMNATNHPFQPTDKVLFYLLTRVINERLQKNEFMRNNKGYNYEAYLRDLLEGKIATNKKFLGRMDYFSSDFSGNFFCLVVEGARSGNLIDIKHIRNQFENKLSNTKTFIYGDQLIVLFCVGDKQSPSRDDMKKISSICTSQGIYAGISNLFPTITELQEYYKQALHAIEIGIQYHTEPGFFRYQDYFMQHMINLFTQKESAKTYCHPAM